MIVKTKQNKAKQNKKMGKKSKRTRNVESKTNTNQESNSNHAELLISPPKKLASESTPKSKSATTLEETFENLQFEDPFEDEYEEEILAEDDDNYKDNDNADINNGKQDDNNGETNSKIVQSWTPFSNKHKLSPDEKLEIDESAYTMHHALTPEWPSLSFSILKDNLGDSRTRFPHSMICAIGTQADKAEKNRLTVMKLSDLAKTNTKSNEDDEMEKPYDEEDDENENENDDDNEDLDPTLEHISIRHNGGVNRVRAMPQMPNIVATWSDVGNVYMYNVQSILDTFDRSIGRPAGNMNNNHRSPFFTYQGHATEGYAMDWSSVVTGQFASGDCSGSIHLWSPQQITDKTKNPSTSSFQITSNAYTSSHKESVEDIQWSPTESTVLASAHCGGNVKIFDTRRTKQAMLTHNASNNTGIDINVIAWNHNVSNLLATGADDGVFSVWDLRTFSSSSSKKIVEPLARFTCHNTPITSLEWHPTDESMILVSDDDAAYVYDLSIETDDIENSETIEDEEIPPQLLFVHAGSNLVKECHWHTQIPSLIMTTALTGFSVFVPSNL